VLVAEVLGVDTHCWTAWCTDINCAVHWCLLGLVVMQRLWLVLRMKH